MLYYPPLPGPTVSVSSSKFVSQTAGLLAPTTHFFRSFAHTHIEIWTLKKCSIICPLSGAHRFSF